MYNCHATREKSRPLFLHKTRLRPDLKKQKLCHLIYVLYISYVTAVNYSHLTLHYLSW